jgi:hypothetical protein
LYTPDHRTRLLSVQPTCHLTHTSEQHTSHLELLWMYYSWGVLILHCNSLQPRVATSEIGLSHLLPSSTRRSPLWRSKTASFAVIYTWTAQQKASKPR